MIIAIASEKGGTGKTTVATNLAVIRAKEKKDVLLIDADPQGSSRDFSAVRESMGHQPSFTSVSLYGIGVASEIKKMAPKFGDVIIDVGGRDTSTMRSALLVADVLVIPFLASQFDAWSIERMDSVVGELQILNDKLRAIIFLNKVDTNPKIGLVEEASLFTASLKNLNFSGIKIGYRVSYRRSIAEGQSVDELERKDTKAIAEIMSLYNEVFKDA